MTTYHPDRWLILQFTPNGEKPYYRVFASWKGGYTAGDSWKINSGIVTARKENKHYHFEGSSGSTYVCFEQNYGSTMYGYSVIQSVIDQMKDTVKIETMPEDTDWLTLDYN